MNIIIVLLLIILHLILLILLWIFMMNLDKNKVKSPLSIYLSNMIKKEYIFLTKNTLKIFQLYEYYYCFITNFSPSYCYKSEWLNKRSYEMTKYPWGCGKKIREELLK